MLFKDLVAKQHPIKYMYSAMRKWEKVGEGGGVHTCTYLQYNEVGVDEIKDRCLYIGPVDGTVEERGVWRFTSQSLSSL